MEELLCLDADRRGTAEIKFVAPIDIGQHVDLLTGPGAVRSTGWLADVDAEGVREVRTALRFTPAGSACPLCLLEERYLSLSSLLP